MRHIIVKGTKTDEGYRMRSYHIEEGGNIVDETRNTVYQILRKLPQPVHIFWCWNNGEDMLFDNGDNVMIK